MILGTAAYMAPEQARGKAVDKRADIWAFGVVLYEMLTGTRAFAGQSYSDVLAAVLREEIDWNRLPAGTPLQLRRLLERCLAGNPQQRLRDIGEARIALAAIERGGPEPAGSISGGGRTGWRERADLGDGRGGGGYRCRAACPALRCRGRSVIAGERLATLDPAACGECS